MRILLTGAAGFVGTRARNRLAELGHEVVTTDIRGRVDYRGDLASAAFTERLPDVDAVAHAAAVQYVTQPRPRFIRRAWFYRNNVRATQNLISRYAGHIEYFMLIGTSMMYEQRHRAAYETSDPMRGEGVYSRSKRRAYDAVANMPNPVGTLVPTIIAGPGRAGLFGTFLGTIQRWGIAVLPGSCTWKTQMVHVDDVADLLACMVHSRSVGLFNAGGPDPLSIREWIRIITDELGGRPPRRISLPYPLVRFGAWITAYRFLAREQTLMLGQDHVLSIRESRSIGWEPQYTNEQILRETARAWSERASR